MTLQNKIPLLFFASSRNDISTQLKLEINVKYLKRAHVKLSHACDSNGPLINATVTVQSLNSDPPNR